MSSGVGTLDLTGEIYLRYKGRPPSKLDVNPVMAAATRGLKSTTGLSANPADILSDILPVDGLTARSGRSEFRNLLFLFSLCRAKTVNQPALSADMATLSAAFANGFDYSQFGIIFHDYDLNRHTEVVIRKEGVQLERGVDDTNTVKFSIPMHTIRDATGLDASQYESVLNTILAINPASVIENAVSMIESVINIPLVLSGSFLQLSETVKQFSESGARLVDSYGAMRSQFDNDGRLARKNFNTAGKTFGLIKKPSVPYNKLLRGLDDMESLIAKGRDSENEFLSAVSDFSAKAEDLYLRLGKLHIPENIPIEQAAVLPNADMTEWFTDPLFEMVTDALNAAIEIEAAIKIAITDTGYTVETLYGETLSSAAQRLLGSESLAPVLAEYNGIQVTDNISGFPLRIPRKTAIPIYNDETENLSPREIESGALGIDLSFDQFRGLEIAPNGDLAISEGMACLAANILDMLDTPEGSLLMWPWWGNPFIPGEAGADAVIIHAQRVTDRLNSDPRVKRAVIHEVLQDGNVGRVMIRVESVYGGKSFTVEI